MYEVNGTFESGNYDLTFSWLRCLCDILPWPSAEEAGVFCGAGSSHYVLIGKSHKFFPLLFVVDDKQTS